VSSHQLHAGRIGPNAITRVAEATRWLIGDQAATDLFDRAGLSSYLAHPPSRMVDEAEVTRLHAAMRQTVGDAMARRVARSAGRRTANYLLAHRIPRPVQAALKLLPARLAARVLLAAIRRHAWTFCGTGEFAARAGQPVRLTLRHNPLCRGAQADAPSCDYYAATFERLFRVLVHRRSRVIETHCEACGDDACRFEIHWPAGGTRRLPAAWPVRRDQAPAEWPRPAPHSSRVIS